MRVPSTSFPEHADTHGVGVSGVNNFAIAIFWFDFAPKLDNPVLRSIMVGIVPIMVCDVVEGNHPAFAHQRRIHFEVSFDAFISVVAINEKKIQRTR